MPVLLHARCQGVSTRSPHAAGIAWTLGAIRASRANVAVIWALPQCRGLPRALRCLGTTIASRDHQPSLRAALAAAVRHLGSALRSTPGMQPNGAGADRRERLQRVPHRAIPGQFRRCATCGSSSPATATSRGRDRTNAFCTTWCATSSTRCCRSVVASGGGVDSRAAARGRGTAVAGPTARRPRAWPSSHRAIPLSGAFRPG